MTRLSSRHRPAPAAVRSWVAPGQVEGSSDAELARKVADADEVALSELYHRFGQPCFSLARRVCVDDGLAEDVVHNVFRLLWRDPWRFQPARSSIATWLLTQAHQVAVEAARRAGTDRPLRTTDPAGDELHPATGEPERADDDGDPAPGGTTTGQVRAALDGLPGEQREVLTAAYFGGHTLREIAAVTDVPLDTVRSHLFTGVQRLRSLLTEHVGPGTSTTGVPAVGEMSR